MRDDVIQSVIHQQFVPKDHPDNWNVIFEANTSSGYDFLLLIENPRTKISYQIEVGIMEDGRLCGQITPDQGGKGPDAMLLFDLSTTRARASDNHGKQKIVMEDLGESEQPRQDNSGSQPASGFY